MLLVCTSVTLFAHDWNTKRGKIDIDALTLERIYVVEQTLHSSLSEMAQQLENGDILYNDTRGEQRLSLLEKHITATDGTIPENRNVSIPTLNTDAEAVQFAIDTTNTALVEYSSLLGAENDAASQEAVMRFMRRAGALIGQFTTVQAQLASGISLETIGESNHHGRYEEMMGMMSHMKQRGRGKGSWMSRGRRGNRGMFRFFWNRERGEETREQG